jgi:hypothetical protein
MLQVVATLPLVTSSARTTGSDPDQEEVVQEETTPNDIPSGLTPSGLTRTKLEPDWQSSNPHVLRRTSKACVTPQDHRGDKERSKWPGLETC